MSENGKLFRAMTWIDDKFILEAENGKGNARKKIIKYLVIAATMACVILITGTNSEVQATWKAVFLQKETILFSHSSKNKLTEIDFSRLPEKIHFKKVEMEDEDFRLYALSNENNDIIWLLQRSNYTNNGNRNELIVEVEGTITKKDGAFGTYWEIEEGTSFGIIWEQTGESFEIAGATSIEEARSIYQSFVTQ